MTIMETKKQDADEKPQAVDAAGSGGADAEKHVSDGKTADKPEQRPAQKPGPFSDKGLAEPTSVKTDVPEEKEIDLGRMNREIELTPEDKAAFVDAIVNNERFTRNYSLFGGKVTLTVRSLTSDEVNALAAWTVKQGTRDPDGLSSGRYRKYLAAAQVAMLNGVEMSPLESPLFEHLGGDGKTVEPPGWVNRCAFWDEMSHGLFSAVMGCLADFDLRYSALCRKAEDANFWNPGTP